MDFDLKAKYWKWEKHWKSQGNCQSDDMGTGTSPLHQHHYILNPKQIFNVLEGLIQK